MQSRIASIVAVTAVCMLMAAAAASASTALITPSGRITEVSVEKITFTAGAGEVVIRCAMTIFGTMFERAEGTLTASPRPEVNPHIGTLETVRVSECTGGMPRFLRGGEKYEARHEESASEWYTYTLHHEFLVESGPLFQCLYDTEIIELYHKINRTEGTLTITSTLVLSETPLVLMGCRSLTLSGRFLLRTESGAAPEFTLR